MANHLPEAFTNRMKEMLGSEYTAFLTSYDKPRYKALRFNPLKGEGTGSEAGVVIDDIASSMERFMTKPMTAVPWAKNGFYYEDSDSPGKHPYHEAGLYYIQEPSAMAPAAYLDARPNERILDLCAAPGGKSTQLASAMRQQGILISNEIHPTRAKILSENVERMGITNAIVTNETPQKLAMLFAGYFDRIIVDAPCSGEGMFRKNDEACAQWSPENVRLCAERQDEILDCADEMLRAGGRLVYSTCTFAPLENEGSIARFLQRHPAYEILQVPLFAGMRQGNPAWAGADGVLPGDMLLSLQNTIRLWPHTLNGEGHFVAVLQKKGSLVSAFEPTSRFGLAQGIRMTDGVIESSGAGNQKQTKKGKAQATAKAPALSLLQAFLNESVKLPLRGTLQLFGDQIYLLPEKAPALTNLRTLRAGLHLGSVLKDRFEPSLSLALCLSPKQVHNYVNLSSADADEYRTALQYLNGLTFPCEGKKGWYLICLDGFSLGWGKLAGGVMKNHYPKGKRKLLQ